MNRFGAFAIHLGISLAIFAVLAYLVLFVWYPDFFFASDGGWQGMRIIVFVDLVLGPTLTLVVFNRKKPVRELRRDLAIIATIQSVCLLAGTYVVYAERPLALVYVDGRFFSMSADDYHEIGKESPSFTGIPGPYPKQVMVDVPDDFTAQSRIRREALIHGVPLRALTDRYQPLDLMKVAHSLDAIPDETMLRRDAATGDLTAWFSHHGGTIRDYAFFPFGARYGYLILGMSKHTGSVEGLLNTQIGIRTEGSAHD